MEPSTTGEELDEMSDTEVEGEEEAALEESVECRSTTVIGMDAKVGPPGDLEMKY